MDRFSITLGGIKQLMAAALLDSTLADRFLYFQDCEETDEKLVRWALEKGIIKL
jgi:hypothetical protein